MSKQEIENNEAWKYISSLTPSKRYKMLFEDGEMIGLIEQKFKVKIEEWAFPRLPEIPDDCVSISVTDGFRNYRAIAVLKPCAVAG